MDDTLNMKNFNDDGLLASLCCIATQHQIQYSINALLAGLPLNQGKLTIKSLMQSAARIGIDTEIKEISLKKIPQINLPVILLMKDGAYVLKGIIDEYTLEIIKPLESNTGTVLTFEEVEQDYAGFAILVNPICQLDKPIAKAFKTTSKSWFWGTLLKFKQIYRQVLLAALLINCFALALPLFIMNVYDRVIPNAAMETLWVFAVGIFIILAFDFLFRMLRSYLIDLTGKKSDILLTSNLYQHLLGIELKHKPESAGAFANHIRGLDTVRDFFTSASISIFVDIPFVAIFISIIAMIAWPLALIPITALILVMIISFLTERPVRDSIARVNVASAQKHAMLVESLTQLESIKALTAEGRLQEKWERFANISAEDGVKSHSLSTMAIHLTAFIQQGVTVAMVIVGVYLINAGALSLGGLIACTTLASRAIAPLSQIISLLSRFQQTRLALKHLNEFMQKPQERGDKSFFYPTKYSGEFKFENVSFSYKSDDNVVLHDLNFCIKPGEKCAILGSIGSGKSTLQKLLLGFYTPTHGDILLDGINLSQLDPAEVRQHIGYVSQQNTLFHGSLRENLLMGSNANSVSDTDMKQALDLVGLNHMVQHHQEGFDRMIGENGQGLSGGQSQALMMARALLRKPKVLILDEPTSAMDATAERWLLKNLLSHCQEMTIIVATHKQSVLGLVDKILILENGKLIRDANKAELLNPSERITVAG